jgi:hypothetical protein
LAEILNWTFGLVQANFQTLNLGPVWLVLPQLGVAWLQLQSCWLLPIDGLALKLAIQSTVWLLGFKMGNPWVARVGFSHTIPEPADTVTHDG